jgi:predicted nucleotidyltransferase
MDRQESIYAILKIAKALGDLNKDVVFVGGAVLSLYVNTEIADEIRPTKDVDITMQITTLGKLEELREKLTNLKFYQTHEDEVICRFRYEDIKVDVMSTHEIGWAPANRWFVVGFDDIQKQLIEGNEINIFRVGCYLATKFEAFNNRGEDDPRWSHDFEDIVYLLAYSDDLVEDLNHEPTNIREYLKEEFHKINHSSILKEAIYSHLNPNFQIELFEKIKGKINRFLISFT